ncbi:hypothetical protein KKB18_00500, partial [bacterium]|nr:hypothetical protein [bacterium]
MNEQSTIFKLKSEKRLKIEVYLFCAVFLLSFFAGITRKYNIYNFWKVDLPLNDIEMKDEIDLIDQAGNNLLKKAEGAKFIILKNLDINADSFDVIDIIIHSKADITQGQVYWLNMEDSSWKFEKSYQFNVGEVVRPIYHKHFSINISENDFWKNKISALCFEFQQGDDTTSLVKSSAHRDFFLKFLNLKYKRLYIGIFISLFTIILLFPKIIRKLSKDEYGFEKKRIRDKVFFTGLILLFAFVTLIPFDVYPGLRFWMSSVPLTIPALVIPYFLLLFFIISLVRKELSSLLKLSGFELSFICLIFASLISFKNAEFLENSNNLLIHFFIPTFLLCYLVIRFLKDKLFFYRLVLWGIFFSTITAAYSLSEYTFNDNILFDRFLITYNPFLATFSNYGPSYGTFIHPNVFGSYLILFIPFSVFIFLNAPNNTWKMYGIVCTFIEVLGLFASR